MRLTNDIGYITNKIGVRLLFDAVSCYDTAMKTTTSISISELGLHLLSLMMKRFGINRSSVLEMIIRDYAERNGLLSRVGAISHESKE